jgi:ATP-dependent DNA helicase DinG
VWSRARSVIVTSATLQSCGSFDYFMHESGLTAVDEAQTLAVPTPFDYARQGRLVVRATASEPRLREAFERESNTLLAQDLARVERGALVLFASRAHMASALAALPAALEGRVLVQGQWSRQRLLSTHRERVDAGQPSIVFGLQSFGEGLDLPGAYCEWLFIAKLPFAPPTDPLGQARAEWLRASGKDAFGLLVVPQTSMRLCQWAGRAIRTEDDQATIVCYDKRLSGTPYGRRILGGLPPFARADDLDTVAAHGSEVV